MCVQKHALQAPALQFLVQGKVAVFVVARDGEAEMGEMNANLVGTPGFEFGFKQAEFRPAFLQGKNGVRGLAVFAHADAAFAVRGQVFEQRQALHGGAHPARHP